MQLKRNSSTNSKPHSNLGGSDPVTNASEIAKTYGFRESRFIRSCPLESDKR